MKKHFQDFFSGIVVLTFRDFRAIASGKEAASYTSLDTSLFSRRNKDLIGAFKEVHTFFIAFMVGSKTVEIEGFDHGGEETSVSSLTSGMESLKKKKIKGLSYSFFISSLQSSVTIQRFL